MSLRRIRSTWKCCATCSRWLGKQTPLDFHCYEVEYDDSEHARCIAGFCQNGGYRYGGDGGNCSDYEKRFK